MNVVIMNKEEKILKALINPKVEISYKVLKNADCKFFSITINDTDYPTPYNEDTLWDFTENWEDFSFILMETDEGWIIDRSVERIFHGRDFEHVRL